MFFGNIFQELPNWNTIKTDQKMRKVTTTSQITPNTPTLKDKNIRNNKNNNEILQLLLSFIMIISNILQKLFQKIKECLRILNNKQKQLYSILEECYEINFIAGEEDAKLRERLRKKFDYSFYEMEHEFEPHENQLLSDTFENTVYNALYTSEIKQNQLKKMKFAPKINHIQKGNNLRNNNNHHQEQCLNDSSKKYKQNQPKIVSFSVNDQ